RILRFPCRICGKRWFNGADLNKHIAHHLKEKHHQCHICKRRFATEAICPVIWNYTKARVATNVPSVWSTTIAFGLCKVIIWKLMWDLPINSIVVSFVGKQKYPQQAGRSLLFIQENDRIFATLVQIHSESGDLKCICSNYHGVVLTKMKDSVPQRQKKKIHKCVVCEKLFSSRAHLQTTFYPILEKNHLNVKHVLKLSVQSRIFHSFANTFIAAWDRE
ncbi:Zinc finger protein-likeGfi-1b, partial [Orchesella cincta]